MWTVSECGSKKLKKLDGMSCQYYWREQLGRFRIRKCYIPRPVEARHLRRQLSSAVIRSRNGGFHFLQKPKLSEVIGQRSSSFNMASPSLSFPISPMGAGNTPDKLTLTCPSSPSSERTVTATLLNEPISPGKTLSITTFPYSDKSVSSIVSPTELFYVSIFPITFIGYTQHQHYQVEFHPGDPRNPVNYSWLRKWCITLVVCAFNGITCKAF